MYMIWCVYVILLFNQHSCGFYLVAMDIVPLLL